jgi:hypothetical protein
MASGGTVGNVSSVKSRDLSLLYLTQMRFKREYVTNKRLQPLYNSTIVGTDVGNETQRHHWQTLHTNAPEQKLAVQRALRGGCGRNAVQFNKCHVHISFGKDDDAQD